MQLIRRILTILDAPLRLISGNDQFLLNFWRILAAVIGLACFVCIGIWIGPTLWAALETAASSVGNFLFTLFSTVGLFLIGVALFDYACGSLIDKSLEPSEESLDSNNSERTTESADSQPETQSRKPTQQRSLSKQHDGRKYDDFEWGHPPPTHKQFGYAKSLGINIDDGMTKWTISDAIDDKKAETEPADRDQLATIKEYHGVLPRKEADDIIEYLEDCYLPCPFCKTEICAPDDECWSCSKKLKSTRIPIEVT